MAKGKGKPRLEDLAQQTIAHESHVEEDTAPEKFDWRKALAELDNDRQRKFIKNYLECDNASKAYVDAGYSAKGARVSAHHMLKRPTIRRIIAAATAEAQKGTEITIERVLKELAHIAFLDIGEAFDKDGHLLPVHKMPENVRRAIAGMDISELKISGDDDKTAASVLKKIKLLDKKASLELLGRNLSMWLPGQEGEGSTGVVLQIIKNPPKES